MEKQLEKQLNKTMNGSLKLDNSSGLRSGDICSTNLHKSNGREIPNTKRSGEPYSANNSTQNKIVENKLQSISLETLEDTTSILNRSGNRSISVSTKRENKILADERDMRKEFHQMKNSCDEEDYESEGLASTNLVANHPRKTSEGNRKVFARQGSVQTWSPNEEQIQKNRTQSFHNEKKNATEVQVCNIR